MTCELCLTYYLASTSDSKPNDQSRALLIKLNIDSDLSLTLFTCKPYS